MNESLPSQSAADMIFRVCCSGVADAALSYVSSTRISVKLGSLWAWQSDATLWNEVLAAAWLHQTNCREWLIFTLLRLRDAFRQRAIMSLLTSTDPTNADACILIQAYASILTEQTSARDAQCDDSEAVVGQVLDDTHALMVPAFDLAQEHFLMRVCEIARQSWWNASALKAVLSVSEWVQDVALDCIDRLRIDNESILKGAASALVSSHVSISAKLGAACTLGRIQISPSSVAVLFHCVADSGVHAELRKQCMLSLLCTSNRLRSEHGDDAGVHSQASIASNLLVVAAVRFACDVDKEVSGIARCICEEHRARLIEFIYGTQSPHDFSINWLVSGDCACATASAVSTVSSFQGDEQVIGALLHLLKRGDKVACISAASALSIIADPSMRVVRECTDAFLNQHGSADNHWSAARQVLAKTLCALVARGVCPAAIFRMCDVVANGLEKVLGIKDRDAAIQEVAMTSSLADLLRAVSLESQDKSRRYTIVDCESEIRDHHANETIILRRDMVEAKRLAIQVIGSHVSVHGWLEGLLGVSDVENPLEHAADVFEAALGFITATAMTDNHDLQSDCLAAVVAFLKLKTVLPSVTKVAVWITECLTRDTSAMHDFMNSTPLETKAHPQASVDKQDDMDFALKDMFLPADMRLQSVLVSEWQSVGQGAWMQLLMRCKLVLGALSYDFLGHDTFCVSAVFDLCAHALQKLSRCLELYDLPVQRIQLVDMVLKFWTTVNACKYHSDCCSHWAVSILSTSNSLTFGIVAPTYIPRYPSLIDQRIVDSVKTHIFIACASIRETNCRINVFSTFMDLKDELWRIITYLAANDGSILHRAQWQRAVFSIARESNSLEWIAEARGLLLSGLMDPTKIVRQTSAELFGTFLEQRAELLQSLHPYMTSKSPDCRLRGIEASLVLFSSPVDCGDGIEPNDMDSYVNLLSSMLDDDNIAVRCAVIDAIAQLDSEGVHLRKILKMLGDPAAEIRLACARVVVGKKLRDVGVASVILGAIAYGKARSKNVRLAELQAVDAISHVGANNPEEWASLLGCIGIASSDSSESMSLMACTSLAKGTGLNIRSAHAAMDIIPLLNDSTACGPSVQLLGSFCERFCCFSLAFVSPVPRVTSTAVSLHSLNSCILRKQSHLDLNIRPLPAACCRGVSDAILKLKSSDAMLSSYEPLILWWFCRVHGLIPCSDTDFLMAMKWMIE